jgi:hypothetical protein
MSRALRLSRSRQITLTLLISVVRRASVVIFLLGIAFLLTVPPHS